ncbi:hypothetical protein BS78_06G043300 [Paspalum vaginatum]|nr:hypothetical protein BS78_06G043300 [Paspalum vaginatum]
MLASPLRPAGSSSTACACANGCGYAVDNSVSHHGDNVSCCHDVLDGACSPSAEGVVLAKRQSRRLGCSCRESVAVPDRSDSKCPMNYA